MAILFKDLYKAADALLSGKATPYITGSEKTYSIKTKAGNISYAAEATQAGDSVKGKVKATLKCSSGFTLKKLELNNSGKLSFDTTLDKAVDNVRFILKGDAQPFDGKNDIPNISAGAQYDHSDFKADLIISSKKNADISACFAKDAFLAGGSITVDLDDIQKAPKFKIGAGYTADGNTATLMMCHNMNFLFTFHRKHTSDIALAASTHITLAKDDDPAKVALELAGSYTADADTTLYAKLSAPTAATKDLKATFHMDHQISSTATLGLTSVLNMDPEDVNNFFGSEFGLSLAFA